MANLSAAGAAGFDQRCVAANRERFCVPSRVDTASTLLCSLHSHLAFARRDTTWEFNAPRYVDLSKLPADGLPENDGADAWFDSPEALAGEFGCQLVASLVSATRYNLKNSS